VSVPHGEHRVDQSDDAPPGRPVGLRGGKGKGSSITSAARARSCRYATTPATVEKLSLYPAHGITAVSAPPAASTRSAKI
jgi:hypothetical protein